MHTPLIMGIVNVTPDSFSDGGQFASESAAVTHARRLLDEGADWVDIGGESTRPGAEPVSVDEEQRRVVPVVEALHEACPQARISVDTRRAAVADAALAAGASMVNDVSAGTDPAMAEVVARHDALWVLMHMRGVPQTMQRDTTYADLVGEVLGFLQERVQGAVDAGVPRANLWVDPGIGFGKALADNPRLVAATPRLRDAVGLPVLIGASRKRFIGELVGEAEPARRLFGSLGVAIAAALHGAHALRVHDVLATRQALAGFEACQ